MAKQERDGGRGRRPGVVTAAKRGGPGRGFWIAIGLLALLGVTGLSWMASRPKVRVAQLDPNLPAVKVEGYVLGSPTAPIEVIEYADFECGVCGHFATLTEPDVRSRYVNTGRIRYRFLDFPLPMHRNTMDAHLAAACANDQGKFWEMHDQIFAYQDRWNGEATTRPRGPLAEVAKSVGLDMTKYDACMEAETHRPRIEASAREAERQGIGQTPTFIIGGQVVPGSLPFDRFKVLLDDALAQAARTPAAAPATPATTAPPAASPRDTVRR
jgi:protein-disulfide isomerase